MIGLAWLRWAMATTLMVLVLPGIIITQTLAVYWTAYKKAPQEIASFITMLDSFAEENENYTLNISKLERLEDRLRLTGSLREIQEHSDDLSQQLSRLVVDPSAVTLRIRTRVFWALERTRIEDRVRRLDFLRMRFLVVYLGIATSVVSNDSPSPTLVPPMPISEVSDIKEALAEDTEEQPPARTLADGEMTPDSKTAWAGVVEELQTSPRMQERHASVETLMNE